MSRKNWGIVLCVIGLIMILLSVFADAIGIGGTPGFGFIQIAALIIGVILIILGLFFFFGSERESVKPTAAPARSAPASSSGQKDDLTKLEGIGPKLQEVLYGAGYTTYASLANASSTAVTSAVQASGFKAPFDASSWPEQAALAAKSDWSGLKTLQGSLTGGRK